MTGQMLVIDSGQRFMVLERDVQFLGDQVSDTQTVRLGARKISRCVPRGSCSNRWRSRRTSAFTISRSETPSACSSASRSGWKTLPSPMATIRSRAWNYDFLRAEVEEIARRRRYNLQETLAHAIFERIAAFRGVKALRVRTVKAGRLPRGARRRDRNRVVLRRSGPMVNGCGTVGCAHAFRMWNKIHCAAFEADIRMPAACR